MDFFLPLRERTANPNPAEETRSFGGAGELSARISRRTVGISRVGGLFRFREEEEEEEEKTVECDREGGGSSLVAIGVALYLSLSLSLSLPSSVRERKWRFQRL